MYIYIYICINTHAHTCKYILIHNIILTYICVLAINLYTHTHIL